METQVDTGFNHRLECVICPQGPRDVFTLDFPTFDLDHGPNFARDIRLVRVNEPVLPRPEYLLHLDPADTSDITQLEGRHHRLRCMAYLYDDSNQDRTALLDDADGEPIIADALEVWSSSDRDILPGNTIRFTWPTFRISEPDWYHFRIEAWYTPVHRGPTRVIATCKSPKFYCFPSYEGTPSDGAGTSSGGASRHGQEGPTSLPGLGIYDRGEGTSSGITRPE